MQRCFQYTPSSVCAASVSCHPTAVDFFFCRGTFYRLFDSLVFHVRSFLSWSLETQNQGITVWTLALYIYGVIGSLLFLSTIHASAKHFCCIHAVCKRLGWLSAPGTCQGIFFTQKVIYRYMLSFSLFGSGSFGAEDDYNVVPNAAQIELLFPRTGGGVPNKLVRYLLRLLTLFTADG